MKWTVVAAVAGLLAPASASARSAAITHGGTTATEQALERVVQRPTRVVKARRNDTLYRVARRYGVGLRTVRRLNPDLPRRLERGTEVHLPLRQRWRRRRFIQLRESAGLRVLTPRRAWGTHLTVTRLREAYAAYAARFPEAEPVWIHDLSRRWGGKLMAHKSHRTGRDVDIRVVLNRPVERYRCASPRTLHLARTWFQVQQLIKSGDVQYIFFDYRLQRALYRYARRQGASAEELEEIFQYPRGRRNPVGIVRHERGHANHLHVRFRPGPIEEIPSV